MAYEVIIQGHLHMPLYFLGTFTEYPYLFDSRMFTCFSIYCFIKKALNDAKSLLIGTDCLVPRIKA